jgi:hypothetical protein
MAVTSFTIHIKHPNNQYQIKIYNLLEKLLQAGQESVPEVKNWKISLDVAIETEAEEFEFSEIQRENDRFSLTLDYIGEGLNGDYEEDGDDTRLLRFYLQEKVETGWKEVDDGSACTLLDATESRKYLLEAAIEMLDYITKHSNEGVNEQALQNLSHAELVNRKLRLPNMT